MIPASERAKTVHALDRSATVTGFLLSTPKKIFSEIQNSFLLTAKILDFTTSATLLLLQQFFIQSKIMFFLRGIKL
jgi:hypothetical protein